jgi:hypothetical protein
LEFIEGQLISGKLIFYFEGDSQQQRLQNAIDIL